METRKTSSIAYGLRAIHIGKLQHVQNAVARLLANTARYSHITLVMIDLHWLPVEFRIILKMILMTFKALHGVAPPYLSDMLSYKSHLRYNLRCNDSNMLVRPAIRSARTTGDRAFSVAVPALWNTLLPSLRAEDNMNIFKRELNPYLFKQAYFS